MQREKASLVATVLLQDLNVIAGLVLAQNIAIQGGQGIVACVKTEASAERVPLRVVIVWTDPPAAPNSPSPLVSDLDLLVVEQDGTTYLGNGRAQKDSVNNVEVVRLFLRYCIDG